MKLYELIGDKAAEQYRDTEITFITDDNRKIQKGCIFVCVKGEKFDGHNAAPKAIEDGAAFVVADHDIGLGDKQILVPDTRKYYGELCAAWFDHPERKMKIIGVTGTNGKTTITNMIKHILMQSGFKTGLIGTIRNEIGDEAIHTENTTPMAFDYMQLLDRMYREGCKYVVMEVSSFGLVQHRVGPTHFDVAVFTNLTQDHLDYHKTMENYYQAKKMMFDSCDTAIINTDDEYGKRLYTEINCDKKSYGTNPLAIYRYTNARMKPDGTTFMFSMGGTAHNAKIKMPGKFNAANASAAIAVLLKCGLNMVDILIPLSQYSGVKGRCEVIPTGRDFAVICDYAHTPDALENVLKSIKEYTEHELICLFGCGGNRDVKKRPLMAQAAARYADKLIITSDNPRDEIPENIIDDILKGLEGSDIPFDVVVDRQKAIYHGLKICQEGDVLLLAGKGHEDYQILSGNKHIHFDEREIVSEGLKLI